MQLLWLILLAILSNACYRMSDTTGDTADDMTLFSDDIPSTRFTRLCAAYLRDYLAHDPVRATALGVHTYDSQYPDLSADRVKERIAALRRWLGQLEAIDRAKLAGEEWYDYRLIEYGIRAELLDLEEVQSWARNPIEYVRTLSAGLSFLVEREFAPLPVRISAMVARMSAMPRVIEQAKANLRDVPKLWADTAASNADGLVTYLKQDLTAALAAQGFAALEPDQQARFASAHARALADVEAFAAWLRNDLGPRARGDFRLGRDLFERKLRFEEHIDKSAEELRAMNERAIARYHTWVAEVAAQIAPDKSPAEVMAMVASRYPSPEELLPTAQRYVTEARQFVIERDLLTLPSQDLPTIRETPPYARNSFASMSAPGPFESKATEAYYNITNVAPEWSETEKAQHLTYFNYPGLLGISVHEAIPGHFVQLLYREELPSDVRKVFMPSAFTEGWAHYVEEMMVDEGLGAGRPEVRLAQLRRALQRHARWHATLALHVDGKPMDEVVARYQEIAFFARFPPESEAKRATYNPTYLHYAYGRMEIQTLRDQVRTAQGDRFSLKEFHNRLLRMGLPVSLAREQLIGTRQPR